MPRACKRCGKCCENIWLPVTEKEARKIGAQDLLEIMVWTGEVHPEGKHYRATCKHYRPPNGKKKAACLIYDKRPKTCSLYPYGAPREQGCGYKGRKNDNKSIGVTV